MKLWQAEQEAQKALKCAKTLEDFVRIGFNSVRYNGKTYFEHKANSNAPDDTNWQAQVELDYIDRDADGFTIIGVKDVIQ